MMDGLDNRMPDEKGNHWKSIIGDSICMLLAVSGMAILIGMIFMMLFTSCAENVGIKKKEPDCISMARECLMLLADKPETVNIIGFSNPDSVYGKAFLNNEELMQIFENISAFNDRVFGSSPSSIDLDNPKLAAQIQRGAIVSDLVQSNILMSDSPVSDNFSGYKMKVLYESLDQFNDTIKNERYFIFDKDMKYILHSFEIPLL